LVSKDSINIVLNDEKIDCDIEFLEDQLERLQTTLSYLLNESVEIVTQFQQSNKYSYNEKKSSNLKKGDVFTWVWKVKKALNIALDLGYTDEFVDMIDGFITHKKNFIEETENMNIADPLVCKHHGRLSNKQIKASSEGDYSKISNSALNLSDSNLYVQPLRQSENTSASRVSFYTINKNTATTQVINDNSVKHKYICQLYGESGHNSKVVIRM
ncbi:5115_t:CDS:2, partial [Dentiscutata erythropus]